MQHEHVAYFRCTLLLLHTYNLIENKMHFELTKNVDEMLHMCTSTPGTNVPYWFIVPYIYGPLSPRWTRDTESHKCDRGPCHMSRIARQPENRLTFSITSTLELKLTLVQWFTCAEPSVRFNIGIDNLADNCMTYGRKMIRNSCSNNWDAIPLTPFVRLKISTAIFCSKRLIFCFVCATKLSVDSWKWSSWH